MRELTTRELDMQLAEQLPARELMGTLRWLTRIGALISGNGNGNGNGNTTGSGRIISFLNGDLNGNLDGNTLIININL
jgi:hypothetical protein